MDKNKLTRKELENAFYELLKTDCNIEMCNNSLIYHFKNRDIIFKQNDSELIFKTNRFISPTDEGMRLNNIKNENLNKMLKLVDKKSYLCDIRDEGQDFLFEQFLEWINKNYSPQLIFYPGCGWHQTPSRVFGEEKVVRFSLEKYFFDEYKPGIKFIGDYNHCPFRREVFSLSLLYDYDLNDKAIDEILNTSNLFVLSIEISSGHNKQYSKVFKKCETLDIPEKFKLHFYLLRKL